MRGFFGVAVWKPKRECNVGTLWRSANVFGASYLAVIAGRYQKQSSDTMATPRHVPLFHFDTFDEFAAYRPQGTRIVGVELVVGARALTAFSHPQQAVYLLGPEDGSLPESILDMCDATVVIPGSHCLNLAVAGSIVCYDRVAKSVTQHLTVERSA